MEANPRSLREQADNLRKRAEKLERAAKLIEEAQDDDYKSPVPRISREPSAKIEDRLKAVKDLIQAKGGTATYSEILATELVPRGSLSGFLKKHFISVDSKWMLKE